MIDTVKIFTQIDKKTYELIKYNSNIKCMYNDFKKQIYYEIINDNLKGSYDSSLSVRIDEGRLYKFKDYVLIVEGSFHKITQGHNAYNGFYNIQEIVLGLKRLVETAYNIKLPSLKHWFLQRIDIVKVYNLDNQDRVMKYINNFRLLNYPRRNLKFYENESVYISGQTTTLKIYNKLREFIKNDRKKIKDYNDFNLYKFEETIKGFIRFECEIKKKKLKDIFDKDFIRIDSIDNKIFDNIWVEEMKKILKFDYSKLKKVRSKDEVCRRLNTIYKSTKASILYAFYLSILIDGYRKVKDFTSESTFYRKIKELKEAGIDFSQSCSIVIEENEYIEFDPFNAYEVV